MKPILLALLLLMVLNACGTPAQAQTGEPQNVQLTMGDHFFEPSTLRFKAGQPVQLEVINKGNVEHELIIGVELERFSWDHHALVKDFFKGMVVNHTEQKGRFKIEPFGTDLKVEAGGRASLTFVVPTDRRGEWELGCFIYGHWEAGMRGTLVVE